MARETIIVRDEAIRQRVLDLIAALNIERPWEITVKPHRKKRSLSQLALMWVWVNEVADHVSRHTGMDAAEVHHFLKGKFLSPSVVELNGEIVEYRTTTKLTTAEMSAYMDRIYDWATSELGMLLRLPEEQFNDSANRRAMP